MEWLLFNESRSERWDCQHRFLLFETKKPHELGYLERAQVNLFFTKDVQIKWQGSMDALEMHTCALQASLVLTPTSYSHHLQPSTSVVTLARSNLPLAGFGHFLAPQLPGPVAPVTVRCKTYDTHITSIGQHVRAKACATSSNQSGAESVEKCSPLCWPGWTVLTGKSHGSTEQHSVIIIMSYFQCWPVY